MIDVVNKIEKENDIIVSERLSVKDMSCKHHLAKNILDASINIMFEGLKLYYQS